MKNFKNSLAELLATFFYIGKIKYCPGTFGSLSAFLFYYFIIAKFFLGYSTFFYLSNSAIILWLMLLGICFMLYFIGLYFTDIYLTYLNSCDSKNTVIDPKEVVIDEVVGQLLVIVLCIPAIFIYDFYLYSKFGYFFYNIIFAFVLPFSLFRFFDILKPWPINWFDQNVKGANGVMIDDIIAAIMASVSYYTINIIIINFISNF